MLKYLHENSERMLAPPLTGAAEIIHGTDLGQYTSGPVQALRHRLKNLNFQNFPSVTKAFQHYDKVGVKTVGYTEDYLHFLWFMTVGSP